MLNSISDNNLFSDLMIFLKETLANEQLSPNCNRIRLSLLQRLLSKNSVVAFYLDMEKSSRGTNQEIEVNNTDCYEELSEWSGSSSDHSRSYNNYPHLSESHCSGMLSSISNGNDKKNNEPSYENTRCDSSNTNRLSQCNSLMSNGSDLSAKSDEYVENSSVPLSSIRYSAVKCGPLSRKEKIIFMDHVKRHWVALLGTTLYIYNSEKDTKPTWTLNVDEYRARKINVSGNNKKEFGFEVVCPGKKTYQFFANKESEMESWISCINHSLPLPQISTMPDSRRGGLSHLDIVNRNCDLEEIIKRPNTLSLGRQLPTIPMKVNNIELYDQPNPIIRPVTPPAEDSLDSLHSETLYCSIEESLSEQLARYDFPVNNGSVYKGAEYDVPPLLYYNTLVKRKDEPSLTQIDESDSVMAAKACNIGAGRIQQIIQRIEEFNKRNSQQISPFCEQPSTSLKDEIYELVHSPAYINTKA